MEIGRRFATRFNSLILLVAIVASLVMTGFGRSSLADDAEEDAVDITGVWELHGRLDGSGNVTELTEDESRGVKFISSGRWCVTFASAETGAVEFHLGGTYTLAGNKYAETVKYANEAAETLFNATNTFEVQIEGDNFTQNGVNNPYNEVWKRVKAEDRQGASE